MTSTQYFRTHDGIRLAYLDTGGAGRPVLALHGAYGRGRSMLGLADHLGPDQRGPGYRVIALDQRGHGLSDHASDYGRQAFIGDITALIEHLDLGPVAMVGHSLGGMNAYQVAARHPELTSAVISVDAPVSFHAPANTAFNNFPARFPSLRALIAALDFIDEPRHFLESVVEEPDGWRFLWQAADIAAVKEGIIGDWWDEFAAVQQPMVVIRGGRSPIIPPEQAAEMARRRPQTELAVVDGHHDFYITHAAELGAMVREFLDRNIGGAGSPAQQPQAAAGTAATATATTAATSAAVTATATATV
ncbi:alpha/beta hydrolase [Catenulispora sp. NL8]|uniref:Alpha/beta hydrolase n=1 Tax=Catenulispora pinistramenti TaxID=2705254 RepID=A0ABS5KTB8_9ACTN|nr:alpha/beta hydrolase [Catenulispora pinistramenti]MBS2549254.1 alpha/beta hydrolase [Catenulispora pinistramenti]